MFILQIVKYVIFNIKFVIFHIKYFIFTMIVIFCFKEDQIVLIEGLY